MLKTIIKGLVALVVIAALFAAATYGLFRWAPIGPQPWHAELEKPFWQTGNSTALAVWLGVWGGLTAIGWLVWMRRGTVALLTLIVFAAIFGGASYGLFRWMPVASQSWYSGLRKPFWTPDIQIARTVWVVVWMLSALAAWLVLVQRQNQARVGVPLFLFFLQFLLALGWCGLFFGLERPEYALIGIAVVWLAILAATVSFSNISTLATLLMVPSLLWFGFILALNFTVWRWY